MNFARSLSTHKALDEIMNHDVFVQKHTNIHIEKLDERGGGEIN